MSKVLSLAYKGLGHVSPNPMVGCVIVKAGKVVAQGYHQKFGGPHAEVNALKKAGSKAKGSTLYVNLEPCFHFGKTPPCVDAIIKAGVKEVVIGMKDPNPLVAGKSIAKLRRTKIKVTTGVLQKQCEDLNVAFIKWINFKMPFVTAKCAQTLDGKIACRTGKSKWITSEATRYFSRSLRQKFDAILIGANTMHKDDPCLHQTDGLIKVIVDSKLRLKETAKLFKVSNPNEIVLATTNQASKAKIKRFESKGITVLVAPVSGRSKGRSVTTSQTPSRVNLKWLFAKLAKLGVGHLLLEGGGTIIGSALKDKLVDQMHIFIAPKIVGDTQAIGSISGLAPKTIDQALDLEVINIQPIGQDLFYHAKVIK